MKTFIGISCLNVVAIASTAQYYLSDLQVYHFMHHIDFKNDSVLFYIREADFVLAVKELYSKLSSSCVLLCGHDSDNDCWIELKLKKDLVY